MSTERTTQSDAAGSAPAAIQSRLVHVLERLELALENLPNQLASLGERGAHDPVVLKSVMTQQEVLDLVGVDERTLRRWRHEGRFPAPIESGGRKLLWRRRDVERWINEGTP